MMSLCATVLYARGLCVVGFSNTARVQQARGKGRRGAPAAAGGAAIEPAGAAPGPAPGRATTAPLARQTPHLGLAPGVALWVRPLRVAQDLDLTPAAREGGRSGGWAAGTDWAVERVASGRSGAGSWRLVGARARTYPRAACAHARTHAHAHARTHTHTHTHTHMHAHTHARTHTHTQHTHAHTHGGPGAHLPDRGALLCGALLDRPHKQRLEPPLVDARGDVAHAEAQRGDRKVGGLELDILLLRSALALGPGADGMG